MTLLEAVNHVLQQNGMAPVDTITPEPPTSHAVDALRAVDTSARQRQAVGDEYNIDVDEVLSVGAGNRIARPPEALNVVGRGKDAGRITTRGGYLVNTETNDIVFGDDESVEVTVTYRFEFSCIPHHVQEFIVADAALAFSQLHAINVIGKSRPGDRAFVLIRRRADAIDNMHRIEAGVRGRNVSRTISSRQISGELPLY